MKFIVGNQIIKKTLDAVKNAVGSPIDNPVVGNILVQAEEAEGSITCTATNLNMTIRSTTQDCRVDQSGAILLEAGVLLPVIRALPDDDLLFEVKPDEFTATLKCGKFKAKINGDDPSQFPPFQSVDKSEPHYDLRIPGSTLKDVLSKLLIAVSRDNEISRYQTNGIQFELNDGVWRGCSTDGRRLSVYEAHEFEASVERSPQIIIAPAKTLRETLRSGLDGDDVQLTIGGRKMEIQSNGVAIVSNLLHGNFPEINRIIPKPGETLLRVDRAAFASAVHRVSVLSSRETKMVMLSVGKTDNQIILQCERDETGGAATDSLECEYSGPPFEIRLNHDYLLDFLQGSMSESVELLCQPDDGIQRKPIILRPIGNDEFRYILMPMRPPNDESSEGEK